MRQTVKKGVAQVILDVPPVNAFNLEHWRTLRDLVRSLGEKDTVRVLVLRAEGRGFCAGVDIKELARAPDLITQVNRACFEAFEAIHRFPLPVIGAVHGFCLGGGIGIVGSCDILLAAEEASFGLPEIDRGAMGGGAHLLRMVPLQKARRMFFTGAPISAEEMFRLGAVEKVVPRAALHKEALALAGDIATKSPKALRLAKQALNGIEPLDLERSYRFEQGFTLELYMDSDSREARSAFVEKRAARFKRKSS